MIATMMSDWFEVLCSLENFTSIEIEMRDKIWTSLTINEILKILGRACNAKSVVIPKVNMIKGGSIEMN